MHAAIVVRENVANVFSAKIAVLDAQKRRIETLYASECGVESISPYMVGKALEGRLMNSNSCHIYMIYNMWLMVRREELLRILQ